MASLNQQVKNFFINKIKDVIQAKIAEQEALILDQDALKGAAVDKLLADTGTADMYDRYLAIDEEMKNLEAEQRTLGKQMDEIFTRALSNCAPYYYYANSSYIANIRNAAYSLHLESIREAQYPEITAEIDRLNSLMDNAEGAVLLASTDKNLRITLTNLLEKYGGDISDIEDMLPAL